MGKFYESITQQHRDFIASQHLFFVATAPLMPEGHINLSPKGLDSFRVLSPNKVAYLDLISSGNETSAHTLENGRITFMFCSFDTKPLILRLYGKGRTILPQDKEWVSLASHFNLFPGTRQIIEATIKKVQTSCGFGVPLYDYQGDRKLHLEWAEKKGTAGLTRYIMEKNLKSLDGLPTDLANPSRKNT